MKLNTEHQDMTYLFSPFNSVVPHKLQPVTVVLSILIMLILYKTAAAAPSEIQMQTETFIKECFGDSTSLTFKKFSISPALKTNVQNQARQKFFRDEVYSWKVNLGDSIAGYALLDNVLGKAMPITFAVLFDVSGRILKTSIIKYREAIGGEVNNPQWNKQFEGKTMDSSFVVGQDIDGISGATMSVVSITRGVKKLAYLLKEIKDKL